MPTRSQLLRLSSMESTDVSTHTDRFRFNSLVQDLLPDAEFEAEQRSCKIRILSQCDCMVQGNPELIYRAIENIVRNAEAADRIVGVRHALVEEGEPAPWNMPPSRRRSDPAHGR